MLSPDGTMPENTSTVEKTSSSEPHALVQQNFSQTDVASAKPSDISASTASLDTVQQSSSEFDNTASNVVPATEDKQGPTSEPLPTLADARIPSYVDSSDEEYNPEVPSDDETKKANITALVPLDHTEENFEAAENVSANNSTDFDVNANPISKDNEAFVENDDNKDDMTLHEKDNSGDTSDHASPENVQQNVAEEEDEEDEDYDPEVTIAPSTAMAATKESPLELSAAEKLKEAYEAVIQSDLVKLDAFSKLSQEEQMSAIQTLLQQKGVTLPSLSTQASPAPTTDSSHKPRPDLSQPMTPEERAAWDEFLAKEPEYSNWETIDKFPSGLRLFIGNLFNNPQLKEELFRVLNQYGKVIQITIKLGYGFAQFETAEQATNCVNGEKDIPFQGRVLRFNTSYGHKNPQGQMKGRERTDDGNNDFKRFKDADVQIFVTHGSDEGFGKTFRGYLRSANLTYNAKTVSSSESAEQMIEAAYLGSVGACVVNGTKIDLQVFQESPDGGVKFDEYLSVDPSTVCELLGKAKQQKFQKRKEQSFNNNGPRPYSNDDMRPQGSFRPNYNYQGRGSFRKNYNNPNWQRNQDGGPQQQNSWQQRGYYKQNHNQPYNHNQGDYNNNGNFSRQNNNNQYTGYQGNNGQPNMNNQNYGGDGYNGQSNAYNMGNNYPDYQNQGWQNPMGNRPPQNFSAPPQAAQFPSFNQGGNVPPAPTGNAMPMGYANPVAPRGDSAPNPGYQGYPPMGNNNVVPSSGMASMYGHQQVSAPPQQQMPETSSALMDMLAKLGRK